MKVSLFQVVGLCVGVSLIAWTPFILIKNEVLVGVRIAFTLMLFGFGSTMFLMATQPWWKSRFPTLTSDLPLLGVAVFAIGLYTLIPTLIYPSWTKAPRQSILTQ